MRILILGASGMLGNVVMRVLEEMMDWQVYGTVRSDSVRQLLPAEVSERLIFGVDVEQPDALITVFSCVQPNVVVNCIGLVKQLSESDDPLLALPINAMLPHRLARLCRLVGARLVHISTDCVFSGEKGAYRESDPADAPDLYGRSKYLGEVTYPHTITLRTSLIGHELQSTHGLVGWFLNQHGSCNGYTQAIFSGFPTVVLAQIIRDLVIPRHDLSGVFHVASEPISKYDLLKLIASIYGKSIEIVPNEEVKIDRSLDASQFREATGYVAPSWPVLIETMYRYQYELLQK